MDIDPAWCHQQALGIDVLARPGVGQLAVARDCGDRSVLNGDVATKSGCAGSVYDGSVSDE